MSVASLHGALEELVHNTWVLRGFGVLVTWAVVFLVTRLSTRFFDVIDRRLTEYGEPARRLSKLDTLFDVFVVLIGVLVSLYILGLGPALWGAVAVTGIAGVILGLAAQRVGQNLLAGIVILFERPFAVGDTIETGGHTGTVSKVTLLTTSLTTPEGPIVLMPNNSMVDGPVRNITAAEGRRVQVLIDVLESRDLERVRAVLEAVPRADPHLDRSRPPQVAAVESLDDGVKWRLRYWVSRLEYQAHCEPASMQLVLDALNDAGLATAMPTQRVHVSSRTDAD